MIEAPFLPFARLVAVGAGRAEVATVEVMIFVTPYAFRRRIAKLDLWGMAFPALRLEVSAFEREVCERVIESLSI